MSAPLVWIVPAAATGFIFWLFRRQVGRVTILSIVFCLLMAVLAWVVPVGQAVRIGSLSFTIDSTFSFAGRRLVLDGGDRVFLIFIYVFCAFWFAGSYAARTNQLMVPFGLEIVALLVAALAVEPFLYAALLIEMAVLLSIPILAPPGGRIGQGVLRFLIFQTLGMPFILLAGWALAGVEANPSNLTLVTLSSVFLALGFSFWLAIFPFYTWIPLLAEQSSPYVSGFIFLLLPTVDMLLGLSFLDRFGWLRATPDFFRLVGQVGVLMVVTAGIWAAFQKDLSRLLGYAVIVETGFSLLALGMVAQVGKELFSAMFIPRMIGFGLWALSLSILMRGAESTRFDDVAGLAQRMPVASAGLAVAALTLGGLPVLPVFPIHQVILEELARQSLASALWVLVGSGSLLFSTFRSLAVLARGSRVSQAASESRLQIALIIAGIAGLLLIGIFPQFFMPMLDGLTSRYNLLP